MTLDKIVSGIYNDLYSGTAGFNANPAINELQLEDECVEKRQVVIKELVAKNLLKLEDLAVTLNCIDVSCDNMVKCDTCYGNCDCPENEENKKKPLIVKNQLHFEIPQLLSDIGNGAIIYIGSADGMVPFRVYYSLESTKANKYRRRGNTEPFVFVDRVPNSNHMCDCWLFNAPFVKQVKVTAVFKDLRQLEEYTCCRDFDYLDFGIISDEVKNRVKKDKFAFYRENLSQPYPTNTVAR